MRVNKERKLRIFIPIMLFLSIIIDSALPAVFPQQFLGNDQRVVSHLFLYWVMMFAFYFRDGQILFFAFLFGLIADAYNTTVLGLYAILYWFLAFLVHRVKRFFPKKSLINYLLFILGICLLDFLVFVFWHETGQTNVILTYFIVKQLVPTLIFNTVLFFVLFFPGRACLRWLGYEDYIIF